MKTQNSNFKAPNTNHLEHRYLKSERGSIGSYDATMEQASQIMSDVKVMTSKKRLILSDLSQIIGNSKKKKLSKKILNHSGTRVMERQNLMTGVMNTQATPASSNHKAMSTKEMQRVQTGMDQKMLIKNAAQTSIVPLPAQHLSNQQRCSSYGTNRGLPKTGTVTD